MKKCNVCHQDKPLSEYSKHKSCAGGVRPTCKSCTSEKEREYRKRRAQKVANRIAKEGMPQSARCARCEEDKPPTEFHEDLSMARGLSSYCKDCAIESSRKRRESDPEAYRRYLDYHKKYSDKNRRLKAKKDKERRESNIDVYRDRARERYRKDPKKVQRQTYQYKTERMKRDPVFRCAENCRRRIASVIKSRGMTKRSTSQEMLGCSWDELAEHLESLFTDGMSWDNRHEWHIDHIIPLASAKTEEEVVRLCHYTNLQPLWARDNMRKGAK